MKTQQLFLRLWNNVHLPVNPNFADIQYFPELTEYYKRASSNVQFPPAIMFVVVGLVRQVATPFP